MTRYTMIGRYNFFWVPVTHERKLQVCVFVRACMHYL